MKYLHEGGVFGEKIAQLELKRFPEALDRFKPKYGPIPSLKKKLEVIRTFWGGTRPSGSEDLHIPHCNFLYKIQWIWWILARFSSFFHFTDQVGPLVGVGIMSGRFLLKGIGP